MESSLLTTNVLISEAVHTGHVCFGTGLNSAIAKNANTKKRKTQSVGNRNFFFPSLAILESSADYDAV